ncbi:acyl-CoA dehydrogenase family protein [Luedemannella helvata]|uniref:SfnB family sulfur acquisition oxidoreductase n=1 Tax=Luedemannella helvata TaxID=349315 RepID=A0ABN2KMA8_9ACTN
MSQPHLNVPGARAAVLTDDAAAVKAAHALAARWREAGPRRDADRAVPVDELAWLSESGLLAMTVRPRYGGAGVPTATLARVFAILSAADTALAQVPQNHFGAVYGLEAEPDDGRKEFLFAEVLRGARFGNAGAERGRHSRRQPTTTIVADGDDYVLNGEKAYCTGALTADYVPVSASHPDGWVGTAFVPRGTPGLVLSEDWDAFGQRATISGSATLTDVRVPARLVFNHAGRPRAATAFRYSRSQLTHAALQVGAAEEALALAERADAGRLGGRFAAWRDDLIVEIAATWALIDRAADLIDEVVAVGSVTGDAALAVGIAVDEAKVLAYELGPAATDALAGFLGDRAGPRFDRYWRNARTHALHDPVRWRRHYVGDHYLNGNPPPFLSWLLTAASDAPL